MSHIAMVLAGSGVKDGSEIHEATLALYFLERLGATVQCYAPNREQVHVINHLTDDTQPTSRHILEESARIARGNVKPVDTLDVTTYDAIIFPGGFGAAKNLCDYAFKGAECSVAPDIAPLITQAHTLKKVLGFMCIAPVIAAKLIPGVTVTVGQECDTAQHIEQLGGIHQISNVDDAIWDDHNKVASTAAYMLGSSIKEVATGIEAFCELVYQHIQ